jgi:pyrroloquinoline quinone biosynthesis protein B
VGELLFILLRSGAVLFFIQQARAGKTLKIRQIAGLAAVDEAVGRATEMGRSVLFIPDIDRWEDWDQQGHRIEDIIARVDTAYLDGTFYANGEIPGRDMSSFPHPFITHSMERFQSLPQSEREKVRFIHLNHTNPALDADSEARGNIESQGFRVAEEMERVAL